MKYCLIYSCLLLFNLCPVTSWSQHRKVLIEQFTNSGCPPCAGNTPVVAGYVNSHPDSILMIAYHTSFPYQDSMYHENPVQSDNRVAFYNVVGVPRSIVDGNYFSGNLLSTLSTTLMTRAIEPPRYQITFLTSTRNSLQIDITISFESVSSLNQGESLVAHVVLVEKNVLKSAYVCCAGANAENEYPWVMRKMMPDENGSPLINNYAGGTDVLTISTNATNFKDLTELRVISYVQNTVSKEIYQSEISHPLVLSSLTDDLPKSGDIFHFSNPLAGDNLDVHFIDDARQYLIEIADVNGRNLYSQYSNRQKVKSVDVSELKGGVYFISVKETGVHVIKKLIVL